MRINDEMRNDQIGTSVRIGHELPRQRMDPNLEDNLKIGPLDASPIVCFCVFKCSDKNS